MDLRGMKLGSASLTIERRLEDFLQMCVCDLPTELLRGLLGEQSYSLDKAWCISGGGISRRGTSFCINHPGSIMC